MDTIYKWTDADIENLAKSVCQLQEHLFEEDSESLVSRYEADY